MEHFGTIFLGLGPGQPIVAILRRTLCARCWLVVKLRWRISWGAKMLFLSRQLRRTKNDNYGRWIGNLTLLPLAKYLDFLLADGKRRSALSIISDRVNFLKILINVCLMPNVAD